MAYKGSDGFLIVGADTLGLGRKASDGRLVPSGPVGAGGGPPPDLTDQGTVTAAATVAGVEALADTGALTSVAAYAAAVALADAGALTSVAALASNPALTDAGAITTLAVLAGSAVAMAPSTYPPTYGVRNAYGALSRPSGGQATTTPGQGRPGRPGARKDLLGARGGDRPGAAGRPGIRSPTSPGTRTLP